MWKLEEGMLYYFSSVFISLQEVEKLRLEKLEIDQQLKSLAGPTTGQYYPPPRERRSGFYPLCCNLTERVRNPAKNHNNDIIYVYRIAELHVVIIQNSLHCDPVFNIYTFLEHNIKI